MDHFAGKDFWKVGIKTTDDTWYYHNKICRSKGGAVVSFNIYSGGIVDYSTLKDIYVVSIKGVEILYTEKLKGTIIKDAVKHPSALDFIGKRFPEWLI